jgi:murein L,D-transpeptidase YcbB/YkuD
MNKFIIPVILAVMFYSCEVSTSSRQSSQDSVKNENAVDTTPVIVRDTSITSENAYNNLFLDSAMVQAFIATYAVPDTEASAIRNFYNQRNYEFAWFSNSGLTDEGRNFWSAYIYSKGSITDTGKDKKLSYVMDTLLNTTDSFLVNAGDSSFVNMELSVTRKFTAYNNDRNNDAIPNYIGIQRLLPTKKIDALVLADSLLKQGDSIGAISNIREPYKALQKQLGIYLSIAKAGEPAPIVLNGRLKKGAVAPEILALKKRFQSTGNLPLTDTSAVFDDSLEVAIKSCQSAIGMQADGAITEAFIKQINIPARQRISQLLVNMNRLLWLPSRLPENYIQVNIPEFMLHVYEHNYKVFDMPVVVGREGTNTMMFTGNLNQVVFSPYWNLPASIVEKEILPAMQRDPRYLEKNRMEVTGQRDSLPVIRQLPGKGNALGRVKFLFPNSYDIYLHDTEAKYLFNANKRAFSHGCIRLADAEKMANYILRDDKEWSREKIAEAMNSDKEKFVRVKNPIPVFITYVTAWVDEAGKLQFRDDIYGRDTTAAAKLFINQ